MLEQIKYHSDNLRKIIFCILIIILIIILTKNISKINLSLIFHHQYISIIVILLAGLFILLKSFQLKTITNIFHKKESFVHFIKSYCMASFIELTTFTGKVGSDGFKYFYWDSMPKKDRILIILLQRSADILGFILLTLTILKPILLIPIAIIIIIILSYLQNKHKHNPILTNIKQHWFILSLMIIISITSYIIIATQLGIIFHTLGAHINQNIITGFLFSHGAGAISQLPLGLGAKDFSLLYLLKNNLSTKTILLGLIWTRLCSEFLSIILGALFLAFTIKKSTKE